MELKGRIVELSPDGKSAICIKEDELTFNLDQIASRGEFDNIGGVFRVETDPVSRTGDFFIAADTVRVKDSFEEIWEMQYELNKHTLEITITKIMTI